MKTIWKFELQVVDVQSVSMPLGAEILTVQTQKGKPCLWAMVESENQLEERFFEIIGTGRPIDVPTDMTKLHYISTFQMYEGSLIFHVFESK